MTTTDTPAARAGSYRIGNVELNRIGYSASSSRVPAFPGRRVIEGRRSI